MLPQYPHKMIKQIDDIICLSLKKAESLRPYDKEKECHHWADLRSIIKFEKHDIRFVMRETESWTKYDQWEPWFVVDDILKALYLDGSISDSEMEKYCIMDDVDSLKLTNETGVYNALLTSKRPNGEIFQFWVYNELLPYGMLKFKKWKHMDK